MQFVTLPHGLTWSDIKILNFINMSIRSYIINKKTKHCATGAKEGDAWIWYLNFVSMKSSVNYNICPDKWPIRSFDQHVITTYIYVYCGSDLQWLYEGSKGGRRVTSGWMDGPNQGLSHRRMASESHVKPSKWWVILSENEFALLTSITWVTWLL